MVQLLASKHARDRRRIARSKPTCKEWRDKVDAADPEDTTLRHAAGDYRYVGIDNGPLTVTETLALIKQRLPEIYRGADETQGNSSSP